MNTNILLKAIKTTSNNFIESVKMPVVEMSKAEVIATIPKNLNTITTVIAILFLVVSVAGSVIRISESKKGY